MRWGCGWRRCGARRFLRRFGVGGDAARHLRDFAARPADRHRDGEGAHHVQQLRGRRLRASSTRWRGSSTTRTALRAAAAPSSEAMCRRSTFATVAANSNMTRTIRMAMKNNAVAAVDIAPPFGDTPDRVPLKAEDKAQHHRSRRRLCFPAPKSGPAISPAACDRTLPIFDGYTRFDLKLSYVGKNDRCRPRATAAPSPSARSATRRSPGTARTGRRSSSWRRTATSRSGWRRSPAPPCSRPYRVSIKTMVGTLTSRPPSFRSARSLSGRRARS